MKLMKYRKHAKKRRKRKKIQQQQKKKIQQKNARTMMVGPEYPGEGAARKEAAGSSLIS